MSRLNHLLLAFALLVSQDTLQAVELTGRFSMLGTTAQTEPGDMGYAADNEALTADQQSLRMMLDDLLQQGEWSLHLKTVRRHLDGYSAVSMPSSQLFRYHEWAGEWMDESSGDSSTRISYEFDRALYRHRFEHVTLGIGRQPIDWGSGRFWQPMNIFGAFSPTDLDTDFKPGIDALTLDWYPSAFSSLAAAYVLAPEDSDDLENSAAFYYRRQVGTISELSLLAGRVLGNRVVGGAFESAWGGMGWRVEGASYRLDETDEHAVFWIAGVDYQFENGTLLAAEWYDNSRGATSEAGIAASEEDLLVGYGLQQQLARQVLGLSAERDITPLLHGGYTLLTAAVEDEEDRLATSLLHQLNLRYSVSNESDLLFSLLLASGSGVNRLEQPRSEFGHLPASMTLRLRFYF